MAAQATGPAVQGQAQRAGRALRHIATGGALQGRSVAAPVEKQDRLLPRIERLLQGSFQGFRDRRLDSAHIDHLGCLHGVGGNPVRQTQQAVMTIPGHAPALQRWRGRTEHHRD